MPDGGAARSGEPRGQPDDTDLVQTLRTRVALLETQLLTRGEADATRHNSLSGSPEGIAVVGSGCRFPGDVSSLEEFWTLLCEGKDAISKIPPTRFDVEEYFDTDAATQGTMNVRVGGFLAQPLDHFDTAAFSMAPREARHLDPQQRLLLECAWDAFDDAGIRFSDVRGSPTGVFVGMMNHDDFIRQHVVGDQITPFTNAGTCMSIAANRISYHFDLQGVSLATDTACSSSLVALHLARRALLNRESSTALCGGVNALMLPGLFIALTKLRMLSPDGRCKAFDASANGYVRSEGCGFVVLKPLHAAQETSDRCYAIVRGSALNSDGRSAIPITAPSVQSQRANLLSAYKCANIAPQMVQFVEAHGTGTQKGDLAETTALADVMGTHERLDNPLLLGSVKTNIGHAESASGIAGLMKAILCLHHGQIPRNLHFDTPNPTIDFTGLRVVDQHLSEWPRANGMGRELMTVGVNSFGFGGTNAHVVLQAAAPAIPAEDSASHKDSTFCLPLSARTASSLIKTAASMATFLDCRHDSLEDICYTTALRRTHHAHRLAVTGESRSDLCAALRDFISTPDAPLPRANQQHCSRGIMNENAPPRLAFVFSGQGSHWAGMGVRLATTCKVFQAELMRVDNMLQPLCGFSVADEVRRFDAASLTHPNIVQPAIFAIQVGVVAVLNSWGVVPTAVIGHSVGEVAAAYCAGALTLSQACHIIAVRSSLCQKVSTCGGMMAAKIAATRAEQELRDVDAEDVEIAAFNSRTSVTFTGSTGAIELMAAALDKRSVPHKLLDICGAFHSRYMDPIKAQLEEQLRDLVPTCCRVPFFSTVTADEVPGPKLDAGYWWSNVRKPVLFHDTISQVRSFGCDGFVEIGPNGILQRYLKEELPLPCWHMATLMKPRDDSEIGRNDGLVRTFAQLFCRGVDCRWEAIYGHGATISCPAYQFDRQRCWVDLQVARPTAPLQELNIQGITGLDACASDQQTVVVQIARTGWLHDHVIQSKIVIPGTAFVEIALAAANQLFSSESDTRGQNFCITNLKWISPLFLDATDVAAVSVDVRMSSASSQPCNWNVSISETTAAKRSEPRQLTHATLHNQSSEWPDSVHGFADLQSKMPDQAAGTIQLSSDEVYDRFAKIGLRYTGLFRAIDTMWINVQSGTSVARICSVGHDGGSYVFHPALLDSILQSMSGALDLRAPLFPVEVESIRLRRAVHSGAEIWTHTQLKESHDSYVIGNIVAYDDTGLPLVEIVGFKVQLLGSQDGNSPTVQSLLYRTRWHSQHLSDKVTTQKRGWTVFLPRNPLVPQLVETVLHGLRERGLLCGRITFGEQFSCRDDKWTVRPDHGEDIAQVISELDRQSIPSAGTLNLLAIERLTEPLEKPGVIERIQQESCMPLFHLHQTYAVQPQKRAIVTVKFGGPSTRQDMRIQSLAQSFLDGIVRTSMLESTNVHCHAVNLSTGSAAEGSSLLHELMHCAEVVCADKEHAQSAEFEVALEEDKRVVPRVERESALVAKHVPAVQASHTYVLVGGLGGLGLTVSQWLLKLGADSLVLTSRSGGSRTALQTLDELRQSHPHARIVVMRSDASDYSDLVAMIDKCNKSSPIKGVFLCTMQLADAYIEAQTSDTVRLAMAAKMDAAWNLHAATLDLRLDFFVMFSSVSGLIGNRGQANYAAGNTFLDALALFRRQQNLPATSIDWGPIGGAGYLAKGQDRLVENLGKQGMRPVSLELLLQALNRIVGQEQLVQVGCIDIDWATYLRTNYTERARAILPARLANIEDTTTLRGGPVVSNSTPSDSRSVEEQLGSIVSQILGIDQEATVLAETSLVSYGLDSLMSSELKLMIESNWNVAVPISNILQGASIRDLANLIGGRDDPSRGAGHPAAAEANDSPVVTIDPVDDSPGPGEDLIDDSPGSDSFTIPKPLPSPRLIMRSPRFAHVAACPDEILQPFAMNDLQFAYYIGRSGAFGAAVPCHFYFEFDREHDELDAVQLERAFNNLIARHEVLRSVVVDGMFVIKQSVPTYHFAVVNLEDHDGDTDSKLEKLRRKYSLEQFDPAQWPLFSVGITKTSRFSRIHVNIDHIILDIKATLSLFAEWAHCYYYPQKKLPHIGFSYRDYSLASGQYKSSEHISAAKAYWMARLHQLPPAPPLPKNLANASAEARSVFTRRTAILDSEHWSKLKLFAAQHNATAANILCTAFCLVLARWSACYCFTINVPVFSKLPVHENVESVLGDFTSSILLQCDLQLASDFKTCVQTIQRQMSSDLDHVDFSGVAVLRELSRLSVGGETSSDTTASGSMASMPVVFTSIIDSNAGNSYGWLGRNVYGISETPQVELDGHVYTMGTELAVNFDFIEARYPDGMVDDMFESYMQLLMTLASDEASWVTKDLQMLPPLQQVERTNANSLHSNEPQNDSSESLVHAILPAMEANKLAIALASGNVQLNYAQLLSTAAELCTSAELRKLPPKSTVAIIMHKGWEQIVAVLATLLLGAAYVPLDAALPHRRLSKLLAQCKAKAAFVQDDCSDWPIPTVAIDTGAICEPLSWTSDKDWLTTCRELLPRWSSVQTHDLAYVLFTSGTTGVPKGVMVEHASVLNTVSFVNGHFQVSSSDVFFGLSQLGFDLSVYDIFGSWMAGAQLVLPLENQVKDPTHWMSLVTQHRVSVWNSVPALMAWKLDSMEWSDKEPMAPSEMSSLRLVLLSGDRIPAALPARIRTCFYNANVVSLGGPTEDTIWSIINEQVDELSPGGLIPYGVPISGMDAHVIDAMENDCPVWTVGEICFSGVGVARGYFENPELTAASFSLHAVTGDRMHRTGDIGRYLPGGKIEIIGRKDFQVKVRGFRIELEEIETVGQSVDGIQEAAVVPIRDDKSSQNYTGLVMCYTTPKPSKKKATIVKQSDSEAIAFKCARLGERRDLGSAIALRRVATQEAQKISQRRRTWRAFTTLPLPLANFESDVLKALCEACACSTAGIQYLLYVRNGGIAGVRSGFYQISEQFSLGDGSTLLSTVEHLPADTVFGENESIFHRSSGAIFMLQSASVCMSLIEAGRVGHRLMQNVASEDAGVGFCPIGAVDASALSACLTPGLGANRVIHTMCFGPVSASSSDNSAQLTASQAREQQLRAHLSSELPQYMVPRSFIEVETMPLTKNGKVDRQALEVLYQSADSNQAASDQSAAHAGNSAGDLTNVSPVEAELLGIWTQRLKGATSITPTDDFLALGGDSLVALQIIVDARAKGLQFSVTDLFTARTIRNMAQTDVGQQFNSDRAQHSYATSMKMKHALPQLLKDPANKFEPFRLTPVQQAYWVGRHSEMNLGNTSTHGFLEWKVANFKLERLQSALVSLVERHEMLRAIIRKDGLQQVLPMSHETFPNVNVIDLTQYRKEESNRRLVETRNRLSHEIFEPSEWPLFSVSAIAVSGGDCFVGFSYDMLVFDVRSIFMFVDQLFQIYHGRQEVYTQPQISFREYTEALERWKEKSDDYRKSIQFWRQTFLERRPCGPDLPLALRPEDIEQPRFLRKELRFPASTWTSFGEKATSNGLTASAALMSLFGMVVRQWCSDQGRPFCINVPVSSRLPIHPDVDRLIGDFTTTIFITFDGSNILFLNQARAITEQLMERIEHRHVSGIEVLRDLSAGDPSMMSEMAVPVVFTSALDISVDTHSDVEFSYGVSQTSQVWLDCQVYAEKDHVVMNWDYVSGLFAPGLVETMATLFLSSVEELSSSSSWDLLKIANSSRMPTVDTDVESASAVQGNQLLHSGFVRNAMSDGQRPAVISGTGTMITYQQLLDRATVIHDWVAQHVPQTEEEQYKLVGVVTNKGWEEVVAVLGVLCAGAAYIPISASLPPNRIRQLLKLSEASCVLTHSEVLSNLGFLDTMAPTLCIDTVDYTSVSQQSRDHIITSGNGASLAYVIFTSGSTGVPKGVMIQHCAAINTIEDINCRFRVDSTDRAFGISSLSFDLSVWDIFGILGCGGCLVLPSVGSERDPTQWVECIQEHGVTIWNSVPQLLGMLVEHVDDTGDVADSLSSLRLALLSGDWIPVGLPDAIRAVTSDKVSVISLGGATEASIWSVVYPIGEVDSSWKSIPYGKALANQSIYCLNENLEPALPWIRGELYIAGAGLAVGYWKAADLTAKQFIFHPVTGERLYKTGDVGRLTDTGDIEFLGRMDSQVKLSGFRVELGEVEAILHGHPQVGHAVALVVDISSSQALVAAVVLTTSVHDAFDEELCSFVKTRLPSYMVPRAVVILDSLPLTKNGKVDDKQLQMRVRQEIEVTTPEDDLGSAPADGPAPRGAAASTVVDPVVSKILKIWEEVLNIPVDPNSDFFTDLSGASAAAIQLINTVNANLNTNMAVAKLFSHPTPVLQAELIRQGGGCDSITPIVDLAPSSSAPHRVYCIHPAGGSSLCYARAARVLETDLHLYGVDDLHSAEQFSQFSDGLDNSIGLHEEDTDSHATQELPIKELARCYAKFILDHAEGEPFALAGFSLGGIVAWEVASHLSEMGVDKLVGVSLIDTSTEGDPAMTDEKILGSLVAHYRRSAGQDVDALDAFSIGSQNQDDLCRHVAARMEAAGMYPHGVGFVALKRFLALFHRHIRMIGNYTSPSTLGIPAVFVSGLDSSTQQREFWSQLCANVGGLMHTAVPCGHDEMLSERHSTTSVGCCAQFFKSNDQDAAQQAQEVELKQLVIECLQVDIDPEQISDGTNLWTLGANSVFYVKLQRRLKTDLGVDVRLPALLAAQRFCDLSAVTAPHITTERNLPEEASREHRFAASPEQDSKQDELATDAGSVAIIGMSCRFPGDANSPEEFWDNLVNAVDCISTFSSSNSTSSNWQGASGLVHGKWMDCFDCQLFQMTRKESSLMDPQHRLFLELGWEALEQSGLRGREESIGVWSSFAPNTYLQSLLKQEAVSEPTGTADMLQLLLANERDYASARMSYLLDLRGPSMNVQTACSSSLVAMSLAHESLNRGECAAAVVGAVSLAFPMRRGYTWEHGGIFSKRGRCAAFDASADGTVPGFGGAGVVLRPLATVDHSTQSKQCAVRAVLRGAAVNHDGRRKPGFTAPSMEAQLEVLRAAFVSAERSPSSLGMVEAHGTGTVLGDPIEGTALIHLLNSATGDSPRSVPVALGSVKSNIGHLDAAAGLAGVVKVALALENSRIPPTLHVSNPNPSISWGTQLAPVLKARDWPDIQATAGVSSFGMSGTNAHIVLQQHQQHDSKPLEDDARQSVEATDLLTLSAATEVSLLQSVEKLCHWRKNNADATIANVALTLQRRHEHRLGYQAVAVASSGRPISSTDFIVNQSSVVDVVFLFPGQGAQSLGHAASMYSCHACFRSQVQKCCELLCAQEDWHAVGTSVLHAIEHGADASLIDQADQQVCVFVVNYAMAQVWMQCGVTPTCVCGHSLGDLVACCISGAVELEDMLLLIAKRGQLVDSLAGTDGGMLAVRCTEEVLWAELENVDCGKKLALAAVNQQNQLVVAGLQSDVARFESHMKGRGIAAHRLPVQHAFHTLAMEAASKQLERYANNRQSKQKKSTGALVHISTVTGQPLQGEPTAEYFAQQLVLPVQFAAAVESALQDAPRCVEGVGGTAHRVLLEVGSSTTLTSIVNGLGKALSSLPHHSHSSMDGYAHWLQTLGVLWSLGVPVKLAGLSGHDEARFMTKLPSYAFDRQQLTAASQRATGETTAIPETGPQADATEPNIEVLRTLFQDVLSLADSVDTNSDFFTLRGSSLDAVQLLNKVTSMLGVTITLSQFLQQPTVQGLYELVAVAEQQPLSNDSEPVRSTDTVHEPVPDPWQPLSFSQEAIYSTEHIYPQNDGAYNLPSAFILPVGTTTPAKLSDRLSRLVARHDALRAVFRPNHSAKATEYAPRMSIVDACTIVVEQLDVHQNGGSKHTDYREALDNELRRFTNQPFDLQAGPLIRAAVVPKVFLSSEGVEVTVVVVVLHHLVCDGLSAGVLLGNLADTMAAENEEFSGPEQSYTQFIRWERRWIETRPASVALEYWRSELAGLLHKEDALTSTLQLMPIKPHRAESPHRESAFGRRERSFGGGTVPVSLSSGTVKSLRHYASQCGVTLTAVLLGLYSCLLWKYAGRGENTLHPRVIPIGIPVANRPPGFQRLVGCCMNMVVLCCDIKPDELLSSFLVDLQRKMGAAIDNSYPFTELVRRLAPPRAKGGNPLYQAVFNVRPSVQRSTAAAGRSLGQQLPYAFDSNRSQNDIGLHLLEPMQSTSGAYEEDNSYSCRGYLEYNDQVLDRSGATELVRSFLSLAEYVATEGAVSSTAMKISTLHDASSADRILNS